MQLTKEFRLTALVFGLTALLVPPGAGAATPLLPAAAGDLQPQQISEAPAMTLANTSREPVAFAWALDAAPRQIVSAADPYQAQSRSYRLLVSGAQLNSGVALITTAPGALVRLHPGDGARQAMPALEDFEIVSGSRSLRGAAAMESLASADALRATPLGAQPGTIAFRTSRALGAGTLTLRSVSRLPADARYAVNVFDQFSDVVLRARNDRDAYFSGDTLHASVAFDAEASAAALEAFLLAPDGTRLAANVAARGKGRFDVSATAPYATAPGQLWELHASGNVTVNGVAVPRAINTAFAVTHASARFVGSATVDSRDGLRISLPVETAADGRYEARAVLFGSDAKGTLRAVARVAAARWIATGAAEIELVVESGLVAGSGLGAPFELRDLRLIDQSRMGTLHRQARALLIE